MAAGADRARRHGARVASAAGMSTGRGRSPLVRSRGPAVWRSGCRAVGFLSGRGWGRRVGGVGLARLLPSLGAHALRGAIPVWADARASLGGGVGVAIAQPADPDGSGPITLTGVRARASSAPVAASLCGRNFGNPDLAAFNRAARRFGVDPSPYIAASDHSAPELLEALAQCPDFEPHA